jgi:hypothetical protein
LLVVGFGFGDRFCGRDSAIARVMPRPTGVDVNTSKPTAYDFLFSFSGVERQGRLTLRQLRLSFMILRFHSWVPGG